MGRKMRLTRRRTNPGVTLIEMAIVVAVIGLIATIIVPLLVRSIRQEKLSEGRRLVRSVRDEIVGYAIIHKRLPASLADVGHSKDAWLGDILYRPAPDLVTSDICDQNSTTLDLIQGASTVDDVAFVVVSRGENYNMQIDNATNHVETYDQGRPVDSYTAGGDPARATDEFDDILEFVTLGYLQSKICTATAQATPTNPNQISFAANMAEFHSPVTPVGVASVVVNQSQKTISLGNNLGTAWGCVWYQGDAANCTAGDCPLGSGARAFFKFRFTNSDSSGASTDFADGFTFAMISADNNPSDACGGNPSAGAYLGYAGSNGVSPSLDYPKFATEIDVYPSGALNDLVNHNHAALVYWGVPGINTDDNTHGVGSPLNPVNTSAGYARNATNVTWLEDAGEHSLRLEVDRNDATRVYTFRGWVDCSNCDDVSVAFGGTPTFTDTITLTPPTHADIATVRFGWTVGTGGRTQTVVISDFVIELLP